MADGRKLRTGVDFRAGSCFDGSRAQIEHQGADIHLAGLRIRNALVQCNSTTDRLKFSVRLRYDFAEGTELWLVFNEGLDAPFRPAAPGMEEVTPDSGSLIVKSAHTLGL